MRSTTLAFSIAAGAASGIAVALHGWRLGALWSTLWARWRYRWRAYRDRPLVRQRATQAAPSLRRRFPW